MDFRLIIKAVGSRKNQLSKSDSVKAISFRGLTVIAVAYTLLWFDSA